MHQGIMSPMHWCQISLGLLKDAGEWRRVDESLPSLELESRPGQFGRPTGT
jgi:hypothetical protein